MKSSLKKVKAVIIDIVGADNIHQFNRLSQLILLKDDQIDQVLDNKISSSLKALNLTLGEAIDKIGSLRSTKIEMRHSGSKWGSFYKFETNAFRIMQDRCSCGYKWGK